MHVLSLQCVCHFDIDDANASKDKVLQLICAIVSLPLMKYISIILKRGTLDFVIHVKMSAESISMVTTVASGLTVPDDDSVSTADRGRSKWSVSVNRMGFLVSSAGFAVVTVVVVALFCRLAKLEAQTDRNKS